jgi:segregation and condensation protein B
MENDIELTELEVTEGLAQEFGNIEPVKEEATEALTPVEITLPSELEDTQVRSVVESILFAQVHPISFAQLKGVFYGTNVTSDRLHTILNHMETDYAGGDRGVSLSEVAGGFQLRTKGENSGWLRKLAKARPFKLSGPALEVLSIVAYKQPLIKSEIDDIRGVESGHLLRALMEKNLVKFAGKSELPGKPMLYATTKQFLELFGLRNIRELPTLSEIDKLIPEGIGELSEIEGGETLGSLADKIAIAPGKSYSESETELLSITDALSGISTSTEFFEQEKIRERDKRDQERAQDLKERQVVGETLSEVDSKWLARYDARILAQAQAAQAATILPADFVAESTVEVTGPEMATTTAGSEAAPETVTETVTESVSEPAPAEKGHDVASHAAAAMAAARSLLDE